MIKKRLFKGGKFHLLLFFVTILFVIYSTSQYTTTATATSIVLLDNHYSPQQRLDETNYLAYLPHSGLSNQRIELSNALMLAYLLNRTLIIPPAFLGTVFGWMPRDHLADKLEWLTTPKDFNKICQRPTPGKLSSYVQRSGCPEYRQFGAIPWTELHDLDTLRSFGIRFIFQDIISTETLKHQLNITNDNDMYVHHDTQLYDWRLYENQTLADQLLNEELNYFDSFTGRRYYKVLSPQHFLDRPEKLLYLGGIFGSTRLNLSHSEHIFIQDKIKKVLQYRMDTPLGQTVQAIVDYLGGTGSFMSVHFRTGDNPFKREVSQNLDMFVRNMTMLVQNESYSENKESGCMNIQYRQEQQVSFDSTKYHRANIYIATDHKDPRASYSPLISWFDMFPCTTILNDLPDYLFAPLDSIKDIVVPSKPLKKFLIPIVDAMVAAHGKRILTTPRSTFSKYIEELHESWIYK